MNLLARLLAAQYLTYNRELDFLCWARFGITMTTMVVTITGPLWMYLYYEVESLGIGMLESDRVRSGFVVALAGLTVWGLFLPIKARVVSKAMVVAETMTDKEMSSLLRKTYFLCAGFTLLWIAWGIGFIVIRGVIQA